MKAVKGYSLEGWKEQDKRRTSFKMTWDKRCKKDAKISGAQVFVCLLVNRM